MIYYSQILIDAEVGFVKLSEIQQLTRNLSLKSQESFKLAEELQRLGFDPGSFYQELEMDSLYVDTHQDISYSNANIHFHSHTFYELLCCRNTSGTEYMINSERYKLQKGDIIFVPPGVSHRPLLPETVTEPYIRDVLWISDTFMERILPFFPEGSAEKFAQPGLFRSAGTNWDFLPQLFRQGVIEFERSQDGWEVMVYANTLTILSHLNRASHDAHAIPLKAEKPELLDQVLAYVEVHLSEKLTLGDIAHQFFVSESTITQTFRKKLGVSFYRCVTQRRLIAAKTLIESGSTMESVAESVGFSDYSAFFRAFKQEYGISPRQYRKMHIAE